MVSQTGRPQDIDGLMGRKEITKDRSRVVLNTYIQNSVKGETSQKPQKTVLQKLLFKAVLRLQI